MPDALLHAVGSDCEREPTCQGRRARKAELAQPHAGEQAGEQVDHELHDIPRDDAAESRVQRPEQKSERPSWVIRLSRSLRTERIGIQPRRMSVLQLTA